MVKVNPLVYLDEMGGMTIKIPKIFMTFSILSMASLALPGMSSFVAQLTATEQT
jgi:NAD(P)H-quinone oxidoreductase subunit 4